jgi:predicted alpha/beta-fold hydrolase
MPKGTHRAWLGAMRRTTIRPSAFRAHGLLPGPMAQMTAGLMLRAASAQRFRVERLETPDDDFVELGWVNESGRGPIAVLVHGLGGGLRSGYVHAMAAGLARRGWTSAILQLRGAGAEPNRQPGILHHADTADFTWLCQRLRREHGGRPLVAIGWSLGGSIVLNALGQQGARSPVAAAAVVSAPLRLFECAQHLRSKSGRLYQDVMLRYVKSLVRRKVARGLWSRDYDARAVLAAKDFFELGDAYIAPLCGFRDGREYCRRADPGCSLPGIRRPTLVVQARDDPFLGPAVVPRRRAAPAVRVELADRGGHVGFVGPGPWGEPRSWLEPRLSRFLHAALRRAGHRLN